MTYEISKDFHFSAAHHLAGLPDGHKCAAHHGHNYVVTVVLRSPTVNTVGFVLDYADLVPIQEWIDTTLDHRDLNDTTTDNSTAENLARLVCDQVRRLVRVPAGIRVSVGVSETPRTWAWFREP